MPAGLASHGPRPREAGKGWQPVKFTKRFSDKISVKIHDGLRKRRLFPAFHERSKWLVASATGPSRTAGRRQARAPACARRAADGAPSTQRRKDSAALGGAPRGVLPGL